MLSGTYYAKNYAGIIGLGLKVIPKGFDLIAVKYCMIKVNRWKNIPNFGRRQKIADEIAGKILMLKLIDR